MTTMPIDIGIDEADRKEIADGLAHLLADTYTLYLKTHNYHILFSVSFLPQILRATSVI